MKNGLINELGNRELFQVATFRTLWMCNWLGHDFQYFREIDSTNSYAKRLKSDDVSHGLVCLAEYQTGGRGQYNRPWVSEAGKNLMFTMVFKPDNKYRLFSLSMVTAHAIAEVIEPKIMKSVRIKWPNDLYIDGRKLGGVLTESIFNGNELDRLIIGVGLNINQESFPITAGSNPISLAAATGSLFNRESLLAQILHSMESCYTAWERNDSDLIKSVNRRLIGYGHQVKLTIDGKPTEAPYKLLGMDENGHLVVLDEEMDVITFTWQQVRVVDGA